MPSMRAFACGAVLLLACTAIVAHAADTPAANATAPAAAAAPANATAAAAAAPVAAAAAPAANKPAVAAAAAAAPVTAPAVNKPVAAAPVVAATPVVAAAANKPVAAATKVAGYEEEGEDKSKKYERYEEGSGSSKGAKPVKKYVVADPEDVCLIPGADCSQLDPACDRYAVQCAPGTECVNICNNCQATCLPVLTCTGVKCPKYFDCQVDSDRNVVVCEPAVTQLPTTCALGYQRVAATGACVRPTFLKATGGNIISIGGGVPTSQRQSAPSGAKAAAPAEKKD